MYVFCSWPSSLFEGYEKRSVPQDEFSRVALFVESQPIDSKDTIMIQSQSFSIHELWDQIGVEGNFQHPICRTNINVDVWKYLTTYVDNKLADVNNRTRF
jgi:hypothetical protein